METITDISEEHHHVRETCGYFLLDDWCLAAASGQDTFTYLQTQTTNDVLALAVGSGLDNALTDRKARLLCSFSVHKNSETSALFLLEKNQRDALIQNLEAYHFREDITFDTRNVPDVLLALQGPKSPALLEALTGQAQRLTKPNDVLKLTIGATEVWGFCKSLTGEEGYVLALPSAFKNQLIQKIEEVGEPYGIAAIGEEAREILRIEAGKLVYGKDMDKTHILPETGLEHSSVSYHKGCYTGQEVIARLKTYGSPAFALMGLVIEGATLPPYNAVIKIKNKKIGTIKSTTYSYSMGKNIALAYIQKDFRSPDQELEVMIGDQPFKVKTALLPFHQTRSRTERAEKLHQEALSFFKKEEDLEKPISLLREALALDPKFAPGYEALGVMLSKQNKLDEAIALMKRLAEIDPQEIMAHTNLSIYYMQQGRIEDAELEKGEATAIQFEKLVEEGRTKREKKKQDKQDREEQERQVGMFKQVLEIDPIDQIANFGLGTIYLDTQKYEEALAPLQTVVENFKDYSAAYLALGKTLEKLSQKEEAAEVYRKGIAAAAKKGDLMPLKDMQSRLNQILHSES